MELETLCRYTDHLIRSLQLAGRRGSSSRRCDTAGARALFMRGLKIDGELAATDPGKCRLQEHLPGSCARLGEFGQAAGDTATARVWVERGLKMRESVVDTDLA